MAKVKNDVRQGVAMVRGVGAARDDTVRPSRETLLRAALFATTALVAVSLANPVAAQTSANNGHVTSPNTGSVTGGGANDGSTLIFSGAGNVAVDGASINNTSGTPNADGLHLENSGGGGFGISFQNNASTLTTTQSGGAAMYISQSGANLGIGHTVSGNVFTGSYGERYVSTGAIFYERSGTGGSDTYIANGTAIAGIHLTANAGGGADFDSPTISGFATGIYAHSSGGGFGVTTLGGSITTTAFGTGIDVAGTGVSINSQTAIVARTGISASGTDGDINVTTSGGGTIDSNSAGTGTGVLVSDSGTGHIDLHIGAAIGGTTAFANGVSVTTTNPSTAYVDLHTTAAITAATASASNYGVYISTYNSYANRGTIDIGADVTGGSGVYTQAGVYDYIVRAGATVTAGATNGMGFVSGNSGSTFNNAGTVQATGTGGDALEFYGIGTVVNQATGTISGAAKGLSLLNSPTSINNAGTISGGTSAGIYGAMSSNTVNTGTITGNWGIYGTNNPLTLNNSGTITGVIDGINQQAGSARATITNSGTINTTGGAGSAAGIYFLSSTTTNTNTVNNTGTITGGTDATYGYGVSNDADAQLIVNNNSGGTIGGGTGAIRLSGTGAQTVNLNAGSTTGQIAADGSGTVTATVAGNLTGNYVGSTGTGAVNWTLASTGSMQGATFGSAGDTFNWQGGSIGGAINGGGGTDTFNAALGAGNSATLNQSNVTGFENYNLTSGTMTLSGSRTSGSGWQITSGASVNLTGTLTFNSGTAGFQVNGNTGLSTVSIASTGQLTGYIGVYYNAGAQHNFSNAGTITATQDGINANFFGTGTNSGTITATNSAAVYLAQGNSIFTNSGTIIGGNDATTGYGFYGPYGSLTLTNTAGKISGGTGGVAQGSVSGGTNFGGLLRLTNASGAEVSGPTAIAILGSSSLNLTNAGFVAGTAYGVNAAGTGPVKISNSGTIGTGTVTGGVFTVGGAGFAVQALSANITNTGILNSTGASIYQTDTAGTLNLANTGTIGGAARAVDPDDTVVAFGTATILNSGTITTPNYYAVSMLKGGTLTNAAGGQINAGNAGDRYGVDVAGGAATINNYGAITSTGNATASGAGTDDSISRGILLTGADAATINLFAGSTTGAILTGSGNDTLALYNGRGTASLGTETSYTDAVSGASSIFILQNSGTLAAASFGAVDLGSGTNTLMLRGIGDGSAANGTAGAFAISTSTGASILTKADTGTWTLSGAAITPGLAINAGTGGTPGSGGLLIFNGTTGLTGGINVNGAIIRATTTTAFGTGTIHAIDPTIQFAASGTYANPISLESTNPGTDPTVLQLFGTGLTATLSGAITQLGATAQPVVFSAIDTSGNPTAGTLVLTNTFNSWTGTTGINAGTTLLGTTQTISGGSIFDNGVLNYSQNFAGTVSQAISGSGSLLVNGGGYVALFNSSTFTGGTTVDGSTLQVGDGGANGSITGPITLANNALLAFNRTGNPVITSAISGNGNVRLLNSVITLNGNISSTGTVYEDLAGNVTLGGTRSGATTTSDGGYGSGFLLSGTNGQLNVASTGQIQGGQYIGVRVTGQGASVTNLGSITNTGTGGTDQVGAGVAIYTVGGTNTVTNGSATNSAATISGQNNAINQRGSATAALTINNYGSLTANSYSAFENSGSAGALTVNNFGTAALIYGSGGGSNGLNVNSAAGLTLNNQGRIVGNGNGIGSAGAVSIINSGLIGAGSLSGGAGLPTYTSGGTAGIAANGGGSITNNNGGTISGATYGINGTGNFTIVNAGTISGGARAISLAGTTGSSSITNTATGVISATTAGSYGVYSAHTLALINSGQITAATLAGNYSPAVYINGANSTVTNNTTGVITGGRGIELEAGGTISNYGQVTGTTDNALTLFGGGTITNYLGGTLTALGSTGAWGMFAGQNPANNGVTVSTLTNDGTINAGAGIVAISSNATIRNTGTITAQDAGVWGYSGPAISVTNTGTITAATGTGVRFSAGGTLVNNGTISAATAISGIGAFADTVTLGSASTTTGAIALGDGADTLTVMLGATLNGGTIDGGAGTDAFVANGAGTTVIASNVTGFESLSKNGTGTLTLGGTNTGFGTVAINAGTLNVNGGAAIDDTAAVTVAGGATFGLLANETIGSLSGAGNVSLGANTLTFGGDNSSTIFSGVASGSGGLTKIGTGVFTISGANTYTGTTLVQAGTLRFGASDVLADTSTLVVLNGATLDLNGFSDTIGTLNLTGTLTGGGTLTALNYNVYGGSTINQGIGGGALNIYGDTTLNSQVTAAPVNIYAGTLTLGAAERLSDTGAVIIAGGAALALGGNETVGSVAGGGNIALGAGTLTTGGDGTSTMLSGVIWGTGALIKVGTGTFTLSGNNDYSGGTTVAAGTLVSQNTGDGFGTGDLAIASGATAQYDNQSGGAVFVHGGTITGAGTLLFTTAANQVTALGNNGGTVDVALSAGGMIDVEGAGLTIGSTSNQGLWTNNFANLNVGSGATFNGVEGDIRVDALTGSGTVLGGYSGQGSMTVGVAGGSGTFDGTIADNAPDGILALTKTGAGTQTLTGVNTYTGATTISGGTLALAGAGSLAGSAVIDNGVFDIASVSSGGTTIAGLAGNGVVTLGATTLTVAQAGAATFSGTIDGSGGLTKAGAGTLTLGGANTYTGTTTISGGTLALTGTGSLVNSAVTANAVFDVSGVTGGATTIVGLSGTGTVTLGATTLTVAQASSSSFSGTIDGSGGLIKAGAGTLTLGGANTYTGATLVDAGTLALGASDVISDSSALTVASGATFDLGTHSDTVAYAGISGTLAGSGTLTAATYVLNGAVVNGNLGAGTLFNTGGTSILNGTVAASQVQVTAGTLQLGASDRLGDTAALSVVSGATLDLQSFSDTVGNAVLNGMLNGTGTLTAGTYELDGATVNGNLGAGYLYATGLNGRDTVLNGTAAAGLVSMQQGATLRLGASDRLADTAAVYVTGGSTLDLGAFTDTVGSLALTDSTLAGTGTLTATTYSLTNATVNANLGAGTLVQAAGTSILNGTSGAGTVVVTGGTLNLGASDRLADTASVVVFTGGTLDLGTNSDTVGNLLLAGTLNGTGTLNGSTLAGNGATYTLNAGVVNANLGTGILRVVQGASVLNGTAAAEAVQITSGSLALGASNRLADNAAVSVSSGAALDLGANSDTVGTLGLGGTLNGTGTLTAAEYDLAAATVNANLGAGTLFQLGGTSLLNGMGTAATVNVNAGTLTLGASNRLADNAAVGVVTGATLNLGAFDDTVGTLALAGTLNGSGTLTAAEYDLTGATVNANLGAGNLFQVSGTSLLNGTAGAANVMVQGGTLTLGASNRLADTATVVVANGSALDLGANSDTVGLLALSGMLGGTGRLTATQYQLNGATVNANLGAGTLFQLGGTSLLNGMAAAATVNVNAGTLTLGASNRLADNAAVGVATGATFNLGANNDTVGTLALAGTLAGTGTLAAGEYDLMGATVNANLGTGNLFQVSGTSLLNGTAGAANVMIQGGSLALGASERLADTSVVIVASGATLNLGALTVAPLGTPVAPAMGAALVSAEPVTVAAAGTTDTAAGKAVAVSDPFGGTSGPRAMLASDMAVVPVTSLEAIDARQTDTFAVVPATSLGRAGVEYANTFAAEAATPVNETVGILQLNGTLAGNGTLTASQYQLNGATVNANLGTGTLFQLGGTSVLSGTAGVSAVAINAGTLRLGAADRIADAAAVNIASGATFDLANYNETVGSLFGTGTLALGSAALTVGGSNTDFGFGGAVTGSGDLTKTGTGIFTLLGSQPMTGRLNVNAGGVLFAGSTMGSARVQGGVLSGGGTFAGNLSLASGTLSPGVAGQPIAAFQAGSFTATGGSYAVDFAGSAGGYVSDMIRITGVAALSGGSVVPTALEPSANYRLSQEYLILQAGTLSGTFGNGSAFAQVNGSNDLYWRLRYDLVPNATLLEIRKVVDFTAGLGAGASGNQAAVGAALNGGILTGSDAWMNTLNAISALSGAQRQATYDSIGGEALADITTSVALAGNRFTDMLRGRLSAGTSVNSGDVGAIAAVIDGRAPGGTIRQAAPTVGNASALASGGARVNAWLQGYGASGTVDNRFGTARVDDFSAGAAAGLEVQSGAVTAGLAGAVTDVEANVRARLSRNDGTLYQGGGYVAYDDGATFGNVIASYFGGNIDTARSVFIGSTLVGSATGRAGTHGYTFGGSLGHRFAFGDGLFFTPQISGEGVDVTRNAFTENGAGVLSLTAAREKRDLYSAIGELRISHRGVTASGGVVEPYASIGVRANFGDLDTLSAMRFTGAPAGTGAFTIEGARLAKTSALVTGGIDAHPSDDVTIGVEAGSSIAKHERDSRVGLHIKIGF